MRFQKNWEKCKRAITLLMRKAHSQCSWGWGSWGSVTRYKYKTLRNKYANLLKKIKKDYFVKTDVKNNRSRN